MNLGMNGALRARPVNLVNMVGSFYNKGMRTGLNHLNPQTRNSLHSMTDKVFGYNGHLGRAMGVHRDPGPMAAFGTKNDLRAVRNIGAGLAMGAGVGVYNSVQRLRYQEYGGAALNAGMGAAMAGSAMGMQLHRGAMSSHLAMMRTMRMGARFA